MKYQTAYFQNPGEENTEATLKLVREWADLLDIKTVLVASTTGQTGLETLKILKNHRIIVVSHAFGFRNPDQQELNPEIAEQIQRLGGRILTCPHPFAGIGRAVRLKFQTITQEEIMAQTLRLLGQGLKVAVEICLMAADAGLIRTDEDVIAIGGSGHGADTAAVVRPANVNRIFDLKVRGILCKPWDHR